MIKEDHDDYLAFLNEVGLTVAQVDAEVTSSHWKDCESETVAIGDSEIHGKGVRSKVDFSDGTIPAIIDGEWTQWGRFMNHSKHPNVKPIVGIRNIALVPLRKIGKGEEVLVNYRDMLSCLK